MTHKIEVKNRDALSFPCDVLILKYAQGLYGVDRAVAGRLAKDVPLINDMLPEIGDYTLFDTKSRISAKNVLFIGTKPLYEFSYEDIQLFARRGLGICASNIPSAKSIAITLHGVNTGLDEKEALYAEIIGLNEAISQDLYPRYLECISILEISDRRANRLNKYVKDMAHPLSGVPLSFVKSSSMIDAQKAISPMLLFEDTARKAEVRRPGAKPSIFIAMPFLEEMTDVFYFGIQSPIEQAGCLCERADLASFTGDVMQWVKDKISSSELVIVDLTGANAKVYLEIGFAWGIGKQTILLAKSKSELKFDVRGQKCLLYSSIKDLETKLKSEINVLLGK